MPYFHPAYFDVQTGRIKAVNPDSDSLTAYHSLFKGSVSVGDGSYYLNAAGLLQVQNARVSSLGSTPGFVTCNSGGDLSSTASIPVTNGGTGFSSYTTGDFIYATGTTTLSKLGVGTTGQFLSVAAGVPSWQTPTAQTTGKGIGAYRAITTASGSWNASTDYLLDVTYSAGSVSLILPLVTGLAGRCFALKASTSALITVSSTDALIDGSSSFDTSVQYASYTFMCSGTKWVII